MDIGHKRGKGEKITSFSEDIEATVVKDVAVHRPKATLPHPGNKYQSWRNIFTCLEILEANIKVGQILFLV